MSQQPTTDLDELRQIGTLLDGGYLISDKRGIVTQAAAEIERLREVLLLARDRIESERRSGEFDPLLRDIEAALSQEQGEA